MTKQSNEDKYTSTKANELSCNGCLFIYLIKRYFIFLSFCAMSDCMWSSRRNENKLTATYNNNGVIKSYIFFEKFLFTSRDSFSEASKTQLFIKEAKHVVINLDPSTWHTEKKNSEWLGKAESIKNSTKTFFSTFVPYILIVSKCFMR